MKPISFHVAFALFVGLALTTTFWLLMSPVSPYQVGSFDLKLALGVLHIVPIAAASAWGGNPQGDAWGANNVLGWLVAYVQWFCVAWVLLFIVQAFRKTRR